MLIISDSKSLKNICYRLREADFVTVDTEFLRDKTYWPKLCLVQLAGPDELAAVDPLASGIDLTPLSELFDDERVLKVFHSARQDLEIFFHAFGRLPHPIVDTQIAAMVCGFGDSVGYDTLVKRLTGEHIDKGQRFTDWSHRPLSEKQINYALDDVTHLRRIHEDLARQIKKSDRTSWLDEEMAVLTSPETYRLDPENAWRRLKTRSNDGRYLSVLRELAEWREREAQRRDVPRNRVIRDEQLFDIATQRPADSKALARTRGLQSQVAEGRQGKELLSAVQRGLEKPREQQPRPVERENLPSELAPLVDLLKILLKMKCAEAEVAPKLVAGVADLERIAMGQKENVAAMAGWRKELFGTDAQKLRRGELALRVNGDRVEILEVENKEAAE